MTAPLTVLDLLRHGEPLGGRRFRGQRDDPLSERGWQQMREAAGGPCQWDVIVTSPLQRCAAFAQELAGRHGLALEQESRLMELGFGAWEGRTALDIGTERVEAFRADPLHRAPPGAEPLVDFRGRVAAALEALLARHAGRRVLVVAHAGVIRMSVALALDVPLERVFRIQVDNAALTRIEMRGVGKTARPRLIFHNKCA